VKKVGVLRFPGTNCDRDIWKAVEEFGGKPEWLWYQDKFNAGEYESYFIPGGFSYGDYLRSGALAAHSPVMTSLKEASEKGAPIFGICNGFQILCEAGLLPGALLRNAGGRFIDSQVELKVANPNKRFGAKLTANQTVKMPIAHGDGRYHVTADELKKIQDNGQVFCTYVKNPNGSVGDIAGVMNDKKNVVAMMPHPERALFDWMGSEDGRFFF
jgi:phosphoribosylformylglycinamidine synthase